MTRKGKVIVFCAPSGAGKTTLARALQKQIENLHFSVSATTRLPRQNEKDGVDYFFLSKTDFIERVENGEFIEWEEVFGNYYGTLQAHIEEMMNLGKNVVLDIDVKGGLNIKQIFGNEALTLFILPPDITSLESRLRGRQSESEETLKLRLARVPMELELGKQFDASIVNDDLETAVGKLRQIVTEFLNK